MLARQGEQIAGRYQIDSMLGSGGFAEVYQGTDLVLGREVAIKLLSIKPFMETGRHPDDVLAEMKESFQNEARMVARLQDPSTVTLFDFGADQRSHKLYMVLELIRGQTLATFIEAHGRLSAYDGVRVLQCALESLREAHASGLLHRDIKPENLMVSRKLDGTLCVKVVDFGIAKAKHEGASAKTAAGILAGTPRYTPPERIQTRTMDTAGDLYSLGAVLYYALTGTQIYAAQHTTHMIIVSQCAPEPVRFPPHSDIPEALRSVVERMLEKDTSKRYRLAQHVLDDLELLAVELQIARYDLGVPDLRAAAASTQMLEPIPPGLDESSAATIQMDEQEFGAFVSTQSQAVSSPSTPSPSGAHMARADLAPAPEQTPSPSFPASGFPPLSTSLPQAVTGSFTSTPKAQRTALIVASLFVLLLFILLAILALVYLLT